MKKIIATTAALAVLATSSISFAKTQGSYVGLDLHRANVRSNKDDRTSGNDKTQPDYYKEQSKTGLGISYKYAFNFNKYFIAPGAFYERIGTKQDYTGAEGGYTPSFQVKNRYGARVDFGYDINDNLAAYVTAGIANVGYRVTLADYHGGFAGSYGLTNNKIKTSALYGFGFISKLDKDFSLGFEYNTQRFSVKDHDQQSDIRTKATIDMYKISLLYNF